MENRKFLITEENKGKRLDAFLTENFDGKSRSFIQGLIEKEEVLVNSNIKKSNYKLRVGDEVQVNIPDPTHVNIEPEDIPIDIIYEDSDIIVVNKPQGMVVHPAPGNYEGTLVNALLNHCSDLSGINGVARPGIVHRIDKDTSGILVVAKNDNAHNKLSEQFKEHSITRVYLALVEGIIKEDEGTVDAPLARHPKERIKIAIVPGGRRAVTHYKVIKRFKDHTLVECKLETGRTHQIRVHMCHIGHPLVGDPVYGYKKQKFNLEGQMLYAQKLGFVHPKTNEYVEFQCDIPSYFKNVLDILEKQLK
ncbi:23S rRNA pseudouridine1911/1915/1917 synthase [Clostridium pascui]|uniref:RluA family pseudouridine synthase n=1 Tax=Clostridium pascui TaxID=46609 RepID=UPI00195EA5F5|nr:RluA family pseudouridine synthase [Clostridium pascui]MBM7869351.1 23S rRNA pseudouridine1911/1915/1917 synthase [Clostridium pascui]